MAIVAEQVKKQLNVKRYKVQYPISTYTFPRETRIHQVRFDDECMHVKLLDGRVISVPLQWIPTLYNAMPEEREKYEINQNRTMIIWDPDQSTINDEVSIADYIEQKRDSNYEEVGRSRGLHL